MSWRYTPHPGKQTQFFTHPAYIVGYGGAAGSGKTDAMLYHHSYILDFEDQRYRRGEIRESKAWVGFFRRLQPNLRDVEARVLRTFPLIDQGGKYNSTDSIWKYECGLRVMLGAMERPSDWLKFNGFEFVEQNLDELTEFVEEQWDGLGTRMRTSDPALKRFMSRRWGSNPVGPGLLWVRNRFIEPYKENQIPFGKTIRQQVRIGDGTPEHPYRFTHVDSVFIQAFLKDNPSVSPEEYETALRLASPQLAKAMLEGNWYYIAGGLLGDFWRDDIHVVPNHKIPPNVFRFRSGDFGINDPSSITWWYQDFDGVMTAYHQLYIKGLTAEQQAARIREIEMHYGDWDFENNRSMLRRSPLDAQCFKRSGTSGPTIADEFRRNGVTWMPSIKDRFNGIAEVIRRLDQAIDLKTGKKVSIKELGHFAVPGEVKPMIRFMRRCEAHRRVLPVLPQDPNNPGDVPKGVEDHPLDDVMYACSAHPLKPTLAIVRDDDVEDDYERNFRKRGAVAALHGLKR